MDGHGNGLKEVLMMVYFWWLEAFSLTPAVEL